MAARCDNMLDLCAKLNEIVREDLSEKHLHTVQSLTKAFREQEFRDNVERDVLQTLMEVLSKLSGQLEMSSEPRAVYLQLTAECFRSQRNACVQCPHNQNLFRDLGFIKASLWILNALLRLRLESTGYLFEALRCGTQFLGNLAVGNQVCKDDIWMHGFPRLFLDLLDHKDEKTAAYASMLLYTSLDSHKVEEMVLRQENLEVAKKVVGLCRRRPELDWTVLIVTQHFLKSTKLFEKLFVEVSSQERVTLLELLSAQLAEDCGLPAGLADFLVSFFLDSSKAVLGLASCPSGPSCAEEEALTPIRLLDTLCEMTSDRKPFVFLQDHPTLLRTAVELLKEVHFLGKTGDNIFSARQDFSAAGLASHPAASFKAHLVRLVGNLCHANTRNQNQVREMDGIALLLDNCSIDSNNPFIGQWAIFALRVILDQNQENQNVVRALERRGVADDSALREMGFRLEERDGSFLLKPVREDP
ncbi:ataxin-10 isoform X1 [Arapaima gigas]